MFKIVYVLKISYNLPLITSLNFRTIFFCNKAIFVSLKSACDHDAVHCKNNGTCQSGFTDKRYRCLCLSGFTGERCEKGKKP